MLPKRRFFGVGFVFCFVSRPCHKIGSFLARGEEILHSVCGVRIFMRGAVSVPVLYCVKLFPFGLRERPCKDSTKIRNDVTNSVTNESNI